MARSTLWSLYGFREEDLKAGVTMETAYSAFPEICSSYHFWIDAHASLESALADHGRAPANDDDSG